MSFNPPPKTGAQPLPSAPQTPTSPPAGDWITVARIVRPWGRAGELIAELLTDFPERFAERRRLFLRKPGAPPDQHSVREVALEAHRLHQNRILLKFASIDSITDAETLRNLDVAIPSEERAPLQQDAAYIDDLIGCTLIDAHTSTPVGTITGVDRESTNLPLLEIGETLVPFAKAYSPVLDLQAKQLTMTLPEGLLDLNTSETA